MGTIINKEKGNSTTKRAIKSLTTEDTEDHRGNLKAKAKIFLFKNLNQVLIFPSVYL
jgi:hypothetical protein